MQDNSGGKTVGPAIPIEIMPSTLGMPVDGKVMRVVQATDADVAAGYVKVTGGRPIPVIVATATSDVVAGPIQYVYVVSGGFGPAPPDPPPPTNVTALVLNNGTTAIVLNDGTTALILE